ncbi:DMT family transporter [Nonomuraea sp. NPDC050310]|uniref:DMT family transporter n=1 Tax=Nonomuraea sp. NPDC050310 TaxID=3154935 RepID=UPI0033FBA35E
MTGSRTTERSAVGLGAMMLAVTVWAAYALSIRSVASSSLTPGDLALLRFAVPVALLLPWLPRTLRRCRELPLPALTGVAVGAGLPFLLLSEAGGAASTASLVGLVIPGTVPLFVSLLAFVLLRERPGRVRLLALAPIVAGVVVTLVLGPNGVPAAGIVLLLAAGALWSGYTLALGRAGLKPVEVVLVIAVPSLLATIVAMAAGLLDTRMLRGDSTVPDILAIAGVQGVAVGVLSTLCYSFAVRRIGSRTASALGALSPVLTAVLAVPFFHEVPDAVMIAGLALILTGVLAATAASGPRRRAAATAPAGRA